MHISHVRGACVPLAFHAITPAAVDGVDAPGPELRGASKLDIARRHGPHVGSWCGAGAFSPNPLLQQPTATSQRDHP